MQGYAGQRKGDGSIQQGPISLMNTDLPLQVAQVPFNTSHSQTVKYLLTSNIAILILVVCDRRQDY